MGIEGVENLTGEETPSRPTDQEIKDKQQEELEAEREARRERLGGGSSEDE